MKTVGTAAASQELLAPAWDLLCLRSFLVERSRHTCRFFDARLSEDVEADLANHIQTTPTPRLLAVPVATLGIGPVSAVVDMAKRCDPDLVVVAFGQHPSQFPEAAPALPRVDYALAGDPEPILRNLLDCIDTPPRLRRVPGLLFEGKKDLAPYWLEHFRSLVTGSWDGIFWDAYEVGLAHRACRAEVRLSRGNARCPSDRPFGCAHEPLRMWPFDKVAARIMQAGPHGIQEVFVNDAPGFWNWDRLNQWIEALQQVRNTQPWGMCVLPAALDEETIKRLAFVGCRRINILYPSCDLELLRELDVTATPTETLQMIRMLHANGISTQIRVWLGGPEEAPGEEDRAVKMLRALDPSGYALAPFQFRVDSPDYRRLSRAYEAPSLDSWMQWARDPWTHERPLGLWGGAAQQAHLEKMGPHILRRHRRSARVVARRVVDRVRDFSFAEFLSRQTAQPHGLR